MRIWIAGNFRNVHTIRWATWWHEAGHEVRGFGFPDELNPDLPYPQETVPLGVDRAGLRAVTASLFWRRRLREGRPDIVNVQGFTHHAIHLALAGADPLTAVYWGSDVLLGPRCSRAVRMGLRLVTRRARHVYATSREQVDVLREIGCRTDHVDVRPFGIVLADHPPRERPVDAPVIVQNRHLEPIYNVDQILTAMPRVLARVPDAHLVVVGDGSERAALEARARDLGIREHVLFRGAVPADEMPRILASARVYVSASRSDTSSSSLLEALASGIVPVVSDIPGNRGIVEPDRQALLFPLDDADALADALVRALTDDAFAAMCAARGPSRVLEVNGDIATSMRRAERTYAALAAERNPRA